MKKHRCFLPEKNNTGRNIEKLWIGAYILSQNTPSETWTNPELAEEDQKKLHIFWGIWNSVMEEMFISDSSDGWNQRFYKWKPQFYNSRVQTISRGGLDCNKQVGALCAHFFTWDPWWKPRWKMGSVRSSIYGARPLMCLTKLFYLKVLSSLLLRMK